MFKEVKSFEYITVSEAREIMEKIAKERQEKAELLFETRRALRHLRNFSKLNSERAKKLVEDLMQLPQVGRKDLAVKIADIMPRVADEVRVIYAKERALTNEEIGQILELLNKYRE